MIQYSPHILLAVVPAHIALKPKSAFPLQLLEQLKLQGSPGFTDCAAGQLQRPVSEHISSERQSVVLLQTPPVSNAATRLDGQA